MQPLETLDCSTLNQLAGLIFDLDDTFLDHGKLDARAYFALSELREKGFGLLVATGRPAGWGELLARLWPVHAVVSENGAVAHVNTKSGVRRCDTKPADARLMARTKLLAIVAKLELAFPDLHRTDDVHGRISDVTYDVGEHQRVPQARIDAVSKLATELGARTMVSSVHLHLTLDRHDKATGSLSLLRDHFGWDTTLARIRFAFIGDSGNDAACFAAFHTSIAVANLTGRPTLLPRYVTRAPRAAGFVEAARLLLTSDNPMLKPGFSTPSAEK